LILSLIYRSLTKNSVKSGVRFGMGAGILTTLILSIITSVFITLSNTDGFYQPTTSPIVGFLPDLGILLTAGLLITLFIVLMEDDINIPATLVSYLLSSIILLGLIYSVMSGIFVPTILLGIVLFAVEELLFWLDDEKRPFDTGIIFFTIQKKFEAFVDLGAGFGIIGFMIIISTYMGQIISGIVAFLKSLIPFLELVVIAGAVIVAAVVVIYANSLKYRRGGILSPENRSIDKSITPPEVEKATMVCRNCGGWRYRSQSTCQNCGHV